MGTRCSAWHVATVAVLVAAALVAGWPARGSEGLYLLGSDALQLGRADSGTASPRSAYWALMNPAALTGLDRRLELTFYAVWERVEMKPAGLLGNRLDGSLNADGWEGIPAAGVVWPLKNGRHAVGAGLYLPGGGKLEYEEARTILGRLLYGNRDRKLKLQHWMLPIGYGYRFDNGWAVGAGLQVSFSRFGTDQLTLNLVPAGTDNAWDESWGIGFNLGLYKNWEKFAFGAMYKSRQWAQTFEKYRDVIFSSLDYPHLFRAGIAWRPVRRLELTFDYECQLWSETSPFGDGIFEAGLHWNDVHAFKAGVEWLAGERWTLMAGYSGSNSVVDKDHLFLNALVPSLIEAHVTAGVSCAIAGGHSVHLVYVRSMENALTDSGRGDFLSRLAGGSKVTVSGDSVALGYTYRF